VFITVDPVHFVFAVFAAFVGALDATSRRGIIAGDSQTDGGTVTEVNRLLYQSFAERTAADDGSTVIVLDGSGEDFTGRSGTFVYQNYQGQFLATACTVGIFFHTRILASFGVDYQFSFGQEFIDHACGCFHIAAGVVAQVNDQAFAFVVA